MASYVSVKFWKNIYAYDIFVYSFSLCLIWKCFAHFGGTMPPGKKNIVTLVYKVIMYWLKATATFMGSIIGSG